MSREGKIFVGEIIAIVLVLSAIWCWALRPEPEVSVPIDNTIKTMAEEKGIQVIEVDSLENKFVQHTGFGGAGGMGAPLVKTKNAQQFFDIIGNSPGIKILYTIEKEGGEVRMRYWAISSESTFIIEITNTYYPPACYKVNKITENAVIFEKAYEFYISFSVPASIIAVIGIPILGSFLEDVLWAIRRRRNKSPS